MTEFKGKGVPTNKTKGAIGAIYTDTDTGVTYKCTGAYGINGVESYEWKRIFESKTEKIPVEKNEENKVENTEKSFEQFMNPPEEETEAPVEEKPVENTRERVPQNNGGKHNYGKHYNKNRNNKN